MDRRRFLGALLASMGAFAVEPGALWVPPVDASRLPPLAPGAPLTLQRITARLLQNIAARSPLHLVPFAELPLEGRHQFTVTAQLPESVGPEGYGLSLIEPIADAFVNEIKTLGLKRAAPLLLPQSVLRGCVVQSAPYGLSLRGLEMYDLSIEGDRSVLRFDLLGADT